MKALLSALLVACLLAGCAASGFDLPQGSGEVRIEHRIPSK